ncbi:MAG: 1-deoxy-D-xylulose-5-phosphate synthase [Holosporales bacterium]
MTIKPCSSDLLSKLNQNGLSNFTTDDLKDLAKEVRSKILHDKNLNGFLGSCLGIVDLTIALHRVFDVKKDFLFFDIGHQIIPHQYLLEALGYREESLKAKARVFNHKKPAQILSEATASVIYRDLFGHSYDVVTVIGDRSLSSGQAFEALNHLGAIASKKIVILNDNLDEDKDLINGLSVYLKHLRPNHHHFEQHSLFESLGFNYIGPIDGHNFDLLLETLSIIKDSKEQTPIILHIKTKKGKGYAPAEVDSDGLNGIPSFDVQSGRTLVSNKKTSAYYAAETLIELAHKDPKVVVVTLQTPHLQSPFLAFRDLYPERYFEVSVTELHAMALSKGLAFKGLKPYLILNSAFVSQLSDHLLHEISSQNIGVKILIDHAFMRHFGNHLILKRYIISHLTNLKNFSIAFPYFIDDIKQTILSSINDIAGPTLIYLPKRNSRIQERAVEKNGFKKSQVLKKGSGKLAILAYGETIEESLKLVDMLNTNGIPTTLLNIISLTPFDTEALLDLSAHSSHIVTLESGSIESLSKKVLAILNQKELINRTVFHKSLLIENEQDNAFDPLLYFNEIRDWLNQKTKDEDFISVA